MTAGAGRVGLGQFQAFAAGVVLCVYRDQGGYTKTALVLFPHFGAGAFRCHHDNGDVLANLHTLLHDIEAVGVGEAGILLHQRHHLADHGSVLLVRCQVEYQVGLRDQFLVGAHGETVLSGVLPGLALLGNGAVAQGVGYIQATVAQVEALVEALGAAADDDHFLAPQLVHAVGEFRAVHEAALAQLLQLQAQGQGVEVVLSHVLDPRWVGCLQAAHLTPTQALRKTPYE